MADVTKYLIKHPVHHSAVGKKPVTFKRNQIVPASTFSDDDVEGLLAAGAIEAVQPVEEEQPEKKK